MNVERPCGALRCKEYYVQGVLDLSRCDETTIYWCARTQRHVGPDERLVVPEGCQKGRACFEAPEEVVS